MVLDEKIIFDKDCLSGRLLMWKFAWDWLALLMDFVFFPLHWRGSSRWRISNEMNENWWQLLWLFHRRLPVVRFNSLIGLVSRYVSSHSYGRTALWQQWFVTYDFIPTCSLWHLFHHTIERSCDKRCVVKPDFVVCGTELFALTISWSLKQSIWRWVEMVQVVLELFSGQLSDPGTENIFVSDSYSASSRPSWWYL